MSSRVNAFLQKAKLLSDTVKGQVQNEALTTPKKIEQKKQLARPLEIRQSLLNRNIKPKPKKLPVTKPTTAAVVSTLTRVKTTEILPQNKKPIRRVVTSSTNDLARLVQQFQQSAFAHFKQFQTYQRTDKKPLENSLKIIQQEKKKLGNEEDTYSDKIQKLVMLVQQSARKMDQKLSELLQENSRLKALEGVTVQKMIEQIAEEPKEEKNENVVGSVELEEIEEEKYGISLGNLVEQRSTVNGYSLQQLCEQILFEQIKRLQVEENQNKIVKEYQDTIKILENKLMKKVESDEGRQSEIARSYSKNSEIVKNVLEDIYEAVPSSIT